MTMKFSKLFKIYQNEEDNSGENFICIKDVHMFLNASGENIKKSNLWRTLQTFQAKKIIQGKECVTVSAILKYFFTNANTSNTCAKVVKNIEKELLSSKENKNVESSLELYNLIVKTKFHNYTDLFEQADFNERTIFTLVLEHKPHFTTTEWKTICWFENDFSRNEKLQHLDLSYEEILELKYLKHQSLLSVLECGKQLAISSRQQIQRKNIRYQALEKDNQVKLKAGQVHLASVIDNDVKTLADVYCSDSVDHIVCFTPTKPQCHPNVIWVVIFQNKPLPVNYNDLCSRIFYSLKKKHSVYVQHIVSVRVKDAKEFLSEDDIVYRFHLKDAVENSTLQNVSFKWNAGTLIDGTVEYCENQTCEKCFSNVLNQPLSSNNFNIIQEWYVEIPVEAQLFLESFVSKKVVRTHKTPDIFLKKKLEKLYNVHDILLNISNKKFLGVYQKSNSNRLLIEYKSITSVFDITSAAGATSSLKQAENKLKDTANKDLCYYNTYLKYHNIVYEAVNEEIKTEANLRSCHLILMLDNLVRLQYIADPNPGQHRSKQICTLPITLQGLPTDSKLTEEWHLPDCSGNFQCSCKNPIQLRQDDIQFTLLEPRPEEQSQFRQLVNLLTFGYTILWKKLPDDLLEFVEEGRVIQDNYFHNQGETDNSAALTDVDDPGDETEVDHDLVDVLKEYDGGNDSFTYDGHFSSDEDDAMATLETSLENMSILEEPDECFAQDIQDLLQSFGFSKHKVPPLLCKHPPPAIGRDDDIMKIREILDDTLQKMGYDADPVKTVNRILCGPDNKIGKCVLALMKRDARYRTFLPEFPLLHLRKSKINILFSAYKDAGIVQIMKIMRDENQDEWAKLISIQHIDVATKYVKRLSLALHLAFLITFMQHLDHEDLQQFLSDMETDNCAAKSANWADKFQQFIIYGSSRNGTFALHADIMKHCDEVVAISLAERMGGTQGYDLLLAAVKGSLLFSFVNNATSYAPYCVDMLYQHYSAGFFHQCMKKELYTTPFKGSTRNFASDTKREMDHIDVLRGFRSGSNVDSVTCRMSLIDSLNETTTGKDVRLSDKDNDKLGWELTETDLNHIFPVTSLILKRQGLSLQENLHPINVYSKTPIVLPVEILDKCSDDVGKYMLFRYIEKQSMFGLSPDSGIERELELQGPKQLITRAKRAKGTTIKRTIKSKVKFVQTEREEKEEKRQKEVVKQTKKIDCFASANNACQAFLKADSTKPKVAKSLGMQRALKNLLVASGGSAVVNDYILVNVPCLPKLVAQSMRICTIEFAGAKFKLGHVKSGREYLHGVQEMVCGMIKCSEKVDTVIICEEKYSFTPNDMKAFTRQQRQTKSVSDVGHLKVTDKIISDKIFNKDVVTKTNIGKSLISTYLAQNIEMLSIKPSVTVIVDSELNMKKDCHCSEICDCPGYCVPFSYDPDHEEKIKNIENVKQRKGEAEMAVCDWLVHFQDILETGESVVCYVTSGDIDAVYIHLYTVSKFFRKTKDNKFKNPVYVVLMKPGGKKDIYSITGILEVLENKFQDDKIGEKVAFTLCLGGNDILPKFYSISHDTVMRKVVDSELFRSSLFTSKGGDFTLNIELYMEFVKYLYMPKWLLNSNVSYDTVRAITIGKIINENTGGYKTADPRKWLPPQSAIARLAELIQLQIQYLQTVGNHERMLHKSQVKCLVKNLSGEIEYDFGAEAHFSNLSLLPEANIPRTKRRQKETPQKGARKKRPMTSTPKRNQDNAVLY